MMYAVYTKNENGEENIQLFSSNRRLHLQTVQNQLRLFIKDTDLVFLKPIDMAIQSLDKDEKLRMAQLRVAKKLIADVCIEFDLDESVYYSKKREHTYRNIRCCIYRILRDRTDLSLQAIGNLHNRDHATILNGLRIFKDYYERYDEFKYEYEICISVLNKIFTETQKSEL